MKEQIQKYSPLEYKKDQDFKEKVNKDLNLSDDENDIFKTCYQPKNLNESNKN